MSERDEELEPFFAAGRGTGALSEDFLAQLEADAAVQMPSNVVAFRPRVAPRLWTGGGLLAAGVAGLAIGLGVPDTLNTLFLDGGASYELAEFLPVANPANLYGVLE